MPQHLSLVWSLKVPSSVVILGRTIVYVVPGASKGLVQENIGRDAILAERSN